MVRSVLAPLACTCLLVAAAAAGAEMYKWVDESGQIHFSDSPPRNAEAVDLSPEADALGVRPPASRSDSGRAIAYRGDEPSRLAFLKEVMVHFENVPPGREKEIGEMRSGTSCNRPRPIKIQSGYKLKREASLRWHFHDLLRELGYRSPGEIKTSFDAEEESGSDLSIIAIITELEVSECIASEGMASSRMGSLHRAREVRTRVKNASLMTVEWQVRDNLQRQVVYETTTTGSFRDRHFIERTDDLPGTMERAFREAARGLLSERAFAALLEPGDGASLAGAQATPANGKVSLAIEEGRCNGRGPTFQARFEALKESTATIRTPSGHGSGFLVSEDAFVLTNEHVVGTSRKVLVLMDGEEYEGRVVVADKVRDVALVELAERPPGVPLSVCRDRTGVGDVVYVVGTPLDEKLSLTVTRGIISQHRTMDGQAFYQTDAVINKGNSGGPVFNGQGHVIGMAVAGVFAKDGAGMGINYLIPIDEALVALIEETPADSRRSR